MKHKPMLYEKIAGARRCQGREVIGLIGTHHGVGVTHTGLMLTFYMGEELGRKTAYLECNNHHDMSYIQAAYAWNGDKEECFNFHRITCYKEVKPGKIPPILNEDYECIIMDFGIDFASNKDEFLRCSTKIVIGGRSEWDLPKLQQFSDAVKTIRGSETWLYFIPQANEKIINRMKNETQGKIWTVPINNEPVRPSQNINRFFSKIF